MPRGLPPDLSTILTTIHTQIIESTSTIQTKFQIPTWNIYLSTFQSAKSDTIRAIQSCFTLFIITFQPLLILIKIMGMFGMHYIQIFYKRIIQDKIWKWIRGTFLQQFLFVVKMIANKQMSLSNQEILIEIGIVLVLIGTYMLRRWISKKGYVGKMKRWYRRKKRLVYDVSYCYCYCYGFYCVNKNGTVHVYVSVFLCQVRFIGVRRFFDFCSSFESHT